MRGTWCSDGTTGMSFILFKSEEAAQEIADNAYLPPEVSATLRSVAVYPVARDDS